MPSDYTTFNEGPITYSDLQNELATGYPQYPTMVFKKPVPQYDQSVGRTLPMPTVQDVRAIALAGLNLITPHIHQVITDNMIELALSSAISGLEMALSMAITPQIVREPFDWTQGMFDERMGGILLSRWPVTGIEAVYVKFPGAMTSTPVMQYLIPPGWVQVSRNRVSITATYGQLIPAYPNGPGSGAVSPFWYQNPNFQPNRLEVVYQAGFNADCVPGVLASLIIDKASKELLITALPFIAPFSSVNVSIDGVSQSASNMVASLIQTKIGFLDRQILEKEKAVRVQFGQLISAVYL